jgi:hypothetical protein
LASLVSARGAPDGTRRTGSGEDDARSVSCFSSFQILGALAILVAYAFASFRLLGQYSDSRPSSRTLLRSGRKDRGKKSRTGCN